MDLDKAGVGDAQLNVCSLGIVVWLGTEIPCCFEAY